MGNNTNRQGPGCGGARPPVEFTLSQDAIEKAHEAYHAHGWNLTEAIEVGCAIEFKTLRSDLAAIAATLESRGAKCEAHDPKCESLCCRVHSLASERDALRVELQALKTEREEAMKFLSPEPVEPSREAIEATGEYLGLGWGIDSAHTKEALKRAYAIDFAALREQLEDVKDDRNSVAKERDALCSELQAANEGRWLAEQGLSNACSQLEAKDKQLQAANSISAAAHAEIERLTAYAKHHDIINQDRTRLTAELQAARQAYEAHDARLAVRDKHIDALKDQLQAAQAKAQLILDEALAFAERTGETIGRLERNAYLEPITLQTALDGAKAVCQDLTTALKDAAEAWGGWHDEDCSLDDTCRCSGKPLNDKVNNAINRADAFLAANGKGG